MDRAGADVVPGGAGDLCWACSLSGGCVAELTERVVAPAPKHSFDVGGARMSIPVACFVPFGRI